MTLVPGEKLNAREREALARHEGVIERGLKTFVEVGQALLAIRDQRLYRETHRRWDDYCRERWGFGKNYADKQIRAAEVAELVSAVGTAVPTISSERVARALARLVHGNVREYDARQVVDAWSRAVERFGPSPTGDQVASVVADMLATNAERAARELPTPSAAIRLLLRPWADDPDAMVAVWADVVEHLGPDPTVAEAAAYLGECDRRGRRPGPDAILNATLEEAHERYGHALPPPPLPPWEFGIVAGRVRMIDDVLDMLADVDRGILNLAEVRAALVEMQASCEREADEREGFPVGGWTNAPGERRLRARSEQ